MKTNPELHPERYGGDSVYETKKVAEAWHTPEEYRGWLLITIEKYCSRYGKKDSRLQEARKIETYAKFLREFEEKMASQGQDFGDPPTGPDKDFGKELFEKVFGKDPKECQAVLNGVSGKGVRASEIPEDTEIVLPKERLFPEH